ncbi:hypothetical protein [Streptomyces sp. TLI_55]|uniref:hypothetical protein n=1 Tax=Streptomyces sp. TLI_55 TaxID=1938861 RepID=UPI000BE25808|nr:hypothetical protein [Streptomyces sp. TLI_55]
MLATVLAGCSSDDGDRGDAGSSPKPAPTTAGPGADSASPAAAPDAAAKKAVLTTYGRMWEEQMKAYRKASDKGTDLARYASLDALGTFRLDLAHMKKAGTVVTGELGHTPAVSQLDLKAAQPTATVTDCLDLSRWETKRVKTGDVLPLPTAQPLRYQATATVQRWQGRWMVTDYTPHGDRTC